MDTCGSIRVKNTGGFVAHFNIASPTGLQCLHWSTAVNIGESAIMVPENYPVNGAQLWSTVNVELGVQGHEAGDNVIFQQNSHQRAIYTCGGTTLMPSFSYEGLEST